MEVIFMRRPVFHVQLLLAGFLLFPLICASGAMAAESRLALVMGQSAYRAVPALPNAENDGKRMAELLANAGFQVTAAPDLAQNDMRQAIGDFAAKVAASGPDTIVAVFYAGHGLQIDGENYLVPVDVDPKREGDIPLQAVRLNDLMNTLGALPTRMRIFMLDACRNNPFPALNHGAGHGLAIVDTKAGSSGSFISFSTSPGVRGGRRHRRRQSLHDSGAGGRKGAESADRRSLQTGPRRREPGDRWTTGSLGKLVTDGRLQILSR
jgi:Caspase domain